MRQMRASLAVRDAEYGDTLLYWIEFMEWGGAVEIICGLEACERVLGSRFLMGEEVLRLDAVRCGDGHAELHERK